MLSAIDHLGRLMRPYALLLTGAGLALLFFGLPIPKTNLSFNWAGAISSRDEIATDSALQSAAENALGGRPGTIVVMDAQTGRIRASVNLEDAYRQAMMPGSTIKPFTTLAALRAGLIDEDSRTACPGRFTGLSFSLPCVHADHLPPFTPSQAIAYSCNFYFASLGQRLGRDRLVETLEPFGFGQPTGLNGLEANGVVRACNTGNRALVRTEANHVSEQADCAAREAIGESNQIQVTPIQLLTAYTALLNGGHLLQPQIESAGAIHPIQRAQIQISDGERRVLSDGMSGALRYGTAHKARLDSLALSIFGKTGTAAPPKGFRTNGWFIGLAGPPRSVGEVGPADMQIAVLVFLPRAHGAEAAAISRTVFDAYAAAIREQPDSRPSTTVNESQPRANNKPDESIKVRSISSNVTRELSLEDYVLGVMRAEGSMESEPEALKALAVAIRTYAVKNRGRHAKDGYDFCSTTHCQRFAPGDESTSPTGRERVLMAAVHDTQGQILLDDHSQPVEAYFGASCGGETANLGTLWGTTPPAYLRGVHDEFCVAGPHADWTDVITRTDLLHALRSDARTDVGARLDRLSITKIDETGRAEFISLEGEQRKLVRGWDFKIIVGRALGWNRLKSSRFEVSRSGNNFIFHGSGFGHGLGLCQEGAHTMAARGASYQRILEKYFPGTRVQRSTVASPPHSAVSLRLTAKPSPENRGYASTAGGAASFQIQNASGEASLTALCCGKAAIMEGDDEPDWVADLIPALSAWTKVMRRNAAAASASRLVTVSSEHFRLTYPSDVARREADQALNALESTRSDFLRRASAASISIGLPTLEIRFNESTGDFTSRTGQPWWAAAATKNNRIELQPLPLLKRRGVLITTLRHELAHVIIDAVSRDRAPRWLEEGFAIYLAGEGSLYSHYQKRGVMATEELERRLEHPRSQQEMRALYGQAYVNVSDLVRNEGETGVWKKLAQ